MVPPMMDPAIEVFYTHDRIRYAVVPSRLTDVARVVENFILVPPKGHVQG